MTSAQQIALEIDKLQPDLKEFWATTLLLQLSDAVTPLFNAPYTPLNAFKIDLVFTHYQTHQRSYVSSQLQHAFVKYAKDNNLAIGPVLSGNNYPLIDHYNIKRTSTKASMVILTHVLNPRKYMSPYLKTATRETTGGTTAIIKKLEDNQMSLAIFSNWVTTQKPFNSVQALTFIQQIRQFRDPDVKGGFYKAILGNCPKPSIELQRHMEQVGSREYPSVSRASLRGKVNNNTLLAFGAIQDNCDSMFHPFVANVSVTPTKVAAQFESILSIALVLLQTDTGKHTEAENKVLIDSVIKYAKMPEHQELLEVLKPNLRTAATAINKLLEML